MIYAWMTRCGVSSTKDKRERHTHLVFFCTRVWVRTAPLEDCVLFRARRVHVQLYLNKPPVMMTPVQTAARASSVITPDGLVSSFSIYACTRWRTWKRCLWSDVCIWKCEHHRKPLFSKTLNKRPGQIFENLVSPQREEDEEDDEEQHAFIIIIIINNERRR